MKMKSLRSKIILSTGLCVLIIGVFSYSFLYIHLTTLLSEKAERSEIMALEVMQRRINNGLTDLLGIVNLASGNAIIARGIAYTHLETQAARRDTRQAKERMVSTYNASAISGYLQNTSYVDKYMAFNAEGILIQATDTGNTLQDGEKVMGLALFTELQESGSNYIVGLSPSIYRGSTCLAVVARINYYTDAYPTVPGWIYAELNTSFFESTISEYGGEGMFIAKPADISGAIAGGDDLPADMLELPDNQFEHGREISFDGKVYRVLSLPLDYAGLYIYSCADITIFASDNVQIAYLVVVVAITSVAIVLLLGVLLASFVNRPLERLTARIKRISDDNDFEFDAEIEKGSDEIAEVGRVVNEMSMSINHLLETNKTIYEQRRNTEIALLQSQVNPHFLYNTLDSIYWMAQIQSSPGIAKTVRSLSNLLKNLAKGVGDKITLEQELELLMAYADTQSVRFMEMFEIINEIPKEFLQYRIVKFTLQPLVENAIFHGLEPAGRFGTITLGCTEEDGYLLITVTDDGVGMTPEEVEQLMLSAQNPHPSGMAGIGVANVDSRLKLVYGPECGLHYESKKGSYTKVTLRIPKEEKEENV